jgi:ATP-binding cassette subfamily B protein
MVLLSLFGGALGLAQPYLSKYLVDGALLRRDMHALLIASALMFGATVFGSVLTYISGVGYTRLSAGMLFDMRLAVYAHLHALSPRFYAKARLGDLVSRLNGDVAELQRISADTFLTTLTNALFIAGSLTMMLLLSWKLFLFGIALIPISILFFRFYQTRITQLTRELRERSADLGTLFVETLLGMRLVACFNASCFELQRFRQRNDAFISVLMRFQRTSLLGRTLPGTVLTAATIAVFVYGGRQIILGTMTIGTLVAFMAYHARLLSPVQNLLGLSSSITSARVSLARVLELLDTKPEVLDPPNPAPIPVLRHKIVLKDVNVFHDSRRVLEDVSIEIPVGSFSAIVGPSGGGKSTIADLLVRLLDPDSGTVTLDGVDVRDLRLADLRSQIVLIEQNAHLFHTTLFDNIAYARPQSSRAEVEAAAQAAALTDLVNRLPEGLNTVVGERGLTLSAGERQRVALARAFLLSPQVVILDEPSAALDIEREQDLLFSLQRFFQGKTLIVITHKAALSSAAEHVFQLAYGRILESAIPA